MNSSPITQKQMMGCNCGYLSPWVECAWEEPVNQHRLTLLLNQRHTRRAGLEFCHTPTRKQLQQLPQHQGGHQTTPPAPHGTEGQATCFEDVILFQLRGDGESCISALCSSTSFYNKIKNKHPKDILKIPQLTKTYPQDIDFVLGIIREIISTKPPL